ncbi:hypothetical protein ACIQUQ_03900 [Streptomyces sp. NPDC101118]|uniref:hypothetical protein n=1 Tax=Streptomyces sp. NPDC101118 TaxID=3366109 RepID=UPI003824A017
MVIGVAYLLVMPGEGAARGAAAESGRRGFRSVRLEAGPGFPRLSALAAYPVPEGRPPEVLDAHLAGERGRVAALAREYGGTLAAWSHGPAAVPDEGGDRLLHVAPDALMALPDPLPEAEARPRRRWKGDPFGTAAPAEVRAAVEVARRLYGTPEAAPAGLAHLLDPGPAEEDPYPDTRSFWEELTVCVQHLPALGGGGIRAVAFHAEVAASPVVSPGGRTVALRELLAAAADLHAGTVPAAPAGPVPGGFDRAGYAAELRAAVVARVPGLVRTWDAQPLPARYALAALAAFVPPATAGFVLPRLGELPVRPGGPGSAELRLITLLLGGETPGAPGSGGPAGPAALPGADAALLSVAAGVAGDLTAGLGL